MTRRKALTAIFFSAICSLSAWSQGTSSGCDKDASGNEDVRTGTHVTASAANADRKRVSGASPVRELKVASLTFAGDSALPPAMLDETARSLRDLYYEDNKAGLDELLERVLDAWQHHGYFNVKVERPEIQTLKEDSESRTAAITVKIDAGKQYRLDEIRFGDIPPDAPRRLPLTPAVPKDQWPFTAEQLRALFPIQQGDIFDTHKIQEGLEEVRKAWGSRGFINYFAVPSTEIDEMSGLITLLVENYPGKQFRLGQVEVTGLNSEVLRKLLQNSGIMSGSVFDASRYQGFATQSQSVLPGFRAEEDVERRINEESGTVDLIAHSRSCDAP